MWESKASDGRLDDLLAWVVEVVGPEAEVYASSDRVVVLSSVAPPEPPAHLVARPPHSWPFTRVR
jgi:hypothetical protein